MVIAIDFDGVIHDHLHPAAGMVMGPPITGAAEAIAALKQQGHRVVVLTARDRLKPVQEWLDYFHIDVDEVTNLKVAADVYIDDRALRFRSWKAAGIDLFFHYKEDCCLVDKA